MSRLFRNTSLAGAEQVEYKAEGAAQQGFLAWVSTSSDDVVYGLFRRATDELEGPLGLVSYHLKVQDRWDPRTKRSLPGWDIIVFTDHGPVAPQGGEGEEEGHHQDAIQQQQGQPQEQQQEAQQQLQQQQQQQVQPQGNQEEEGQQQEAQQPPAQTDAAGQSSSHVAGTGASGRLGPLKVDRCMSCDMDTPLALGVLGQDALTNMGPGGAGVGPTARDSLVHETEHCRVWLDAKARPMLVVTPQPHLERLSQLTQHQLCALWRDAAAALEGLGLKLYTSMILNHGDHRTHAHLHLKVRVPNYQFTSALRTWPSELAQRYRQLQAFQAQLPQPPRRRGESPWGLIMGQGEGGGARMEDGGGGRRRKGEG